MPRLTRTAYTHLRQALYAVIRLNSGIDPVEEDNIRDAIDAIWDKMINRDRAFISDLPVPDDIKNLMKAKKNEI